LNESCINIAKIAHNRIKNHWNDTDLIRIPRGENTNGKQAVPLEKQMGYANIHPAWLLGLEMPSAV